MLKRYKKIMSSETGYRDQMLVRPDGNWAKYDEAQAEIARLQAEVERLNRALEVSERELEEARKDIEFLQSGKDAVRDGLQAALTAQMALADRLFRRLLIFKDTKFWVQSDDDDLNAYRKERGL